MRHCNKFGVNNYKYNIIKNNVKFEYWINLKEDIYAFDTTLIQILKNKYGKNDIKIKRNLKIMTIEVDNKFNVLEIENTREDLVFIFQEFMKGLDNKSISKEFKNTIYITSTNHEGIVFEIGIIDFDIKIKLSISKLNDLKSDIFDYLISKGLSIKIIN